MSIIHSSKEAILNADEKKEKILINFLDLDIRSENTFVYLKNSELDSEMVISSGEIKFYESISIKNKIITVNFIEPIKPYGKCQLTKIFSINLKRNGDDIILFPSNHSIKDLFVEFISLRENDKKSVLRKKEHKIVFNPILAKYLIHQGFRIIDTKKDKNNPGNWLPVFLADEGFFEAIETFERIEEYKKENNI